MSWNEVEVEMDGPVAVIRIAREGVLNALDLPVLGELHEAFGHIAPTDVGAIVLTGKGRAFSAGGDVAAMRRADDPEAFLYRLGGAIHRIVMDIQESPRPVVAAVNGPAVGAGLGIMLSCDVKVAARSARLSTGFLKVGLAPGCGTWLLAAHLSYARSMEVLLTSRFVDAGEALEIGLVSEVVDDDRLMERAMEVAGVLARMPPIAIARAKSLMQRAYASQLREHLDLERRYLSASGSTAEFAEGTAAFGEKRHPRFRRFD